MKKVTREEAVNELADIFTNLTYWTVYHNVIKEIYKKALDVNAPNDLLKDLAAGIEEAEENIQTMKEVYDAQLSYIKERGWA